MPKTKIPNKPTPVGSAPSGNKRRPVLIAGVVVIVILLSVPAGFLLAMNGRILPGVTANGIEIGGLTKAAAEAKLNAAVAIYENTGLNFAFGKKGRGVELVQVPNGDADRAHQLLDFDIDSGLKNALAVGRTGNVWQRLADAAAAITGQRQLALPYTLDTPGFTAALHNEWAAEETPVIDSRLIISFDSDALPRVEATPDQSGFEFDYSRAVSDLRAKIATLDVSAIQLQPARTEPNVRINDVEAVEPSVPVAISLAPLPLSAGGQKWTLTAADLAKMLVVSKPANGAPSLRLDPAAAKSYFASLAAEYDVKPVNTTYEVDPATQKMVSFQPGNDGRKIDIEKSIAGLEAALAKQLGGADGRTGYNLTATVDRTQLISQSAAELGIKEIIGVGISDFSGSSANRIKNVRHGSSKLNGLLIAPDQEFSAIDALNPVTIEDGYFPEQIILGDKIEPAVGGGLCQIGTTLFRMAMNSGLPITERQNHSLVVHYYSDPVNNNPGTDATLYGPHPDLRFINNTGHWLLITTAIDVKTKQLTYTLWGTSDGRQGSYTHPQVTNWIPAPAEKQNINDPAQPIGSEKCQNAFRGANTTFTYTIVNPDGTSTAKNFNSHYRALPKICAYGTGIPGAKLPDGTVVPPAPKVPVPNPLANADAPMTNVNVPPETAQGN